MNTGFARRALGKTGLEVSELGFGGAGIGNLYRVLRDEDAAAAVTESFASGVRYFDTAPFYGFGLSELRIGSALRGAQPPPVISTKVGRRLVPTGPQDERVGREGYFSPRPFAPVFDYGYESVRQSHAESLERLGVARVDILLCHDIGRMTHGDAHPARITDFSTAAISPCASCVIWAPFPPSGSASTSGRSVSSCSRLRTRLRAARRALHAARTTGAA